MSSLSKIRLENCIIVGKGRMGMNLATLVQGGLGSKMITVECWKLEGVL